MASMARSALRSAAAKAKSVTSAPKRSFSSKHHDDAYETAKWEKITYAGIVTCTLLAAYNLSKGHHHFPDPPAYPYLHIRNKEFPWGPNGLFEVKHGEHDH
ncbi:hypothetical protein LUZ63_001499 [Rhynchospora breviuscula]|uniref:Uncharacterized protein n=1 Tax=Rhynchospora breviuscula TaxID=2022672 RepID=A0A9Q0CXG9_9POAL|nr:hypothetical protein LUZ63_001499 [Rhynchospora breviuscula]